MDAQEAGDLVHRHDVGEIRGIHRLFPQEDTAPDAFAWVRNRKGL